MLHGHVSVAPLQIMLRLLDELVEDVCTRWIEHLRDALPAFMPCDAVPCIVGRVGAVSSKIPCSVLLLGCLQAAASTCQQLGLLEIRG